MKTPFALPAPDDRCAIEVSVATEDQLPWFDQLLADHHYLGAGRPVGDYLRQVVCINQQPVALLVWGPACYALPERDRWISWNAIQRLERPKLLVQNRRFLVLADKGQRPNLASGTLPVPAGQLDSLLDVFRRAPDPRDDNTRYRIGPVLTLIALALLAGRREIAEIARFATTLTQPQRRRLNLPLKKGTRRFYQVPGYGVFYQVLTRLDPEAFATLLNGWLAARAGTLPAALALDGKMIRDHIGLLALAPPQDGAPPAVAVYDQKENTPRCEQTAAAALLQSRPALDGKLITADPLHCQRAHARTIVEKGGAYLFQIKGSQPKLLRQAQGLDALKDTPFLSPPSPDTDACKPGACTPLTSNP